MTELPQTDVVLNGVGVGRRAATAKAFVLAGEVQLPTYAKSDRTAELELKELTRAIEAVRHELDILAASADETSSEVFAALAELVSDEALLEASTVNLNQGWAADAAFGMAVQEFIELISAGEGSERLADLEWLSRRVRAEYSGIDLARALPTEGRWVLVADDLTPIDTANFTDAIAAVVTLRGGPTSHASIICASRAIPAVVACAQASVVEHSDLLLVDPLANRVVLNPVEQNETLDHQFSQISSEPLISVRANVGSIEDAFAAQRTSASGVGLLRTELLFLQATHAPSLEVQAKKLTELFEASPAGPIVVRTLDVASDKPLAFAVGHADDGQDRGYRFMVENNELITTQLEAIEKARVTSNREIWVMVPMLQTASQVSEFTEKARSIGGYRVGAMVELPSLAAEVSQLAELVDFVSIGTNDLSQYLFDINRNAPANPELLNHWQPQLIRLIAQIAAAAKLAKIDAAVCGAAASDPLFALLLAGLGIGSVSASAAAVDAVSAALKSVNLADAKQAANQALLATTAQEAEAVFERLTAN
jgi:phosphotransferase system enzyme I (PtsI)